MPDSAATATKSIRALGDQDYPPITYLENGVARGFDVDVLKALGAVLGRDIGVTLLPWDVAQRRVQEGSAELLTGMSITEGRRESWAFASPTLKHTFSLFVVSGEVTIHGVDDLRGKRVGITAGGLPRALLSTRPGLNLVVVTNYREGFYLLKKKRIDALAADTLVAGFFLNELGIEGIAIAGEPFATVESAIAVRKGNQALLGEINRGLEILRQRGTIENIRQKWEPKQVVYLLKEEVRTIALLAAGLVGLLLFGGMTAWIVTLKKEAGVRRKVENELRTSEARFRTLVEHAPEAIVVIDADSRQIIDANANAERLFGVSREELLQSRPERFLTAEQPDGIPLAQSISTHIDRTLADEDVVFERKIRNADGRELHCEVRSVRLPSLGRKLIRGSYVDITERKRAQQALQDSENRYRVAIDTMAEGMILYGMGGDVRICNRAAERILGRPIDEIMRSKFPIGGLRAVRADGSPYPLEERPAILTMRTGRSRTGVIVGLLRDSGSINWISVNSAPIFGDDGVTKVGVLSTFFDISGMKRAEQELLEYSEQLRQLSRRLFETEESERRRLARELHDRIGANLTALGLNLNMLHDELHGGRLEKARTRLDDSETLIESTVQLVRDVLVDLRPPGLDELGLLAALKEHAGKVAQRSGLEVEVSGAEPRPRLAPASEIALFRIAQEALTNILKHAHASAAIVTLRATPNLVILTIADNGFGFDGLRPGAGGERGMGMTSMRERAEAIGARSRVDSARGHGTRVIVEVPRAVQPRLAPMREQA